MRTSQYLISTQKESPADAQTASHKLMLRAGMIRQLGSGLYHWLPMGLRVLRKVEAIVREEMQNINAHELLMPAVQPDDIWKESDRWDSFGPELLKITDRHGREGCIAPTHEEAITSMMRNELNSYKQLPISFFQIQNKFRDETRPRAGVLRAREFMMKDAYSFHHDLECLDQTYQKFYQAYVNVFTRLGLEFRAALADTGSIGGSKSHEFHVLAPSGEDKLAISNKSDYCANVELAEAVAVHPHSSKNNKEQKKLEKIETPNATTIETVCKFLNLPQDNSVKLLIVKGADPKQPLIGLVLRGDHELNELKAEKLDYIQQPLAFANPEEIKNTIGCVHGYLGPVDINIPVYIDRSAAVLTNFCCGANQENYHYINVNWHRDCELLESNIKDLRLVEAGDPSPDNNGELEITRGIEVGHIFQLGDVYSKKLSANILNQSGKAIPMQMGCYGIGVSRVVAAAIEQNHDDKGIVWPNNLAPFHIVLIPIGLHKSEKLKNKCEEIYKKLTQLGYETLFDDRNERPGVMFADAELIGIPHRLVLGEKALENNTIEYKSRTSKDSQEISLDQLEVFLATATSLKSAM